MPEMPWRTQGGLIRRVIDRVDEEGDLGLQERLHIAWGVRQLRREGDPLQGVFSSKADQGGGCPAFRTRTSDTR